MSASHGGAQSGTACPKHEPDWYRDLFSPCVTAVVFSGSAHSLCYATTPSTCARRVRAAELGGRPRRLPGSSTWAGGGVAQETGTGLCRAVPGTGSSATHSVSDGNGTWRGSDECDACLRRLPWTVVARSRTANGVFAARDRARIDGDIEPSQGFIAETSGWRWSRKAKQSPDR